MDALPVLPYCAHHRGFKPLSNVRSNVRTRCAERKEEKRETARLESGVSTVAASLSTQPSLAVLPVGLHLQGQRDRKVVETAAEGIHPHISHAGGHNVTSESRGLVPPEAVSLNECSARKCKHAGAHQGHGCCFCWRWLAKHFFLLCWHLERSRRPSPQNV